MHDFTEVGQALEWEQLLTAYVSNMTRIAPLFLVQIETALDTERAGAAGYHVGPRL
jgi:hypothetical protein